MSAEDERRRLQKSKNLKEGLQARWQLRGQRKQGPKKRRYCFPFCLAFPAERLLPNGSSQVDCSFLCGVARLCPQQGKAATIRIFFRA